MLISGISQYIYTTDSTYSQWDVVLFLEITLASHFPRNVRYYFRSPLNDLHSSFFWKAAAVTVTTLFDESFIEKQSPYVYSNSLPQHSSISGCLSTLSTGWNAEIVCVIGNKIVFTIKKPLRNISRTDYRMKHLSMLDVKLLYEEYVWTAHMYLHHHLFSFQEDATVVRKHQSFPNI